MSLVGYKQTFRRVCRSVRFTPESVHRQRKRALDSKSRHSMSAYPPEADVNGYGAGGPLLTHSGS